MNIRTEPGRLLGVRAWGLVKSNGKKMDGPQAGLYVSGLPTDELFALARRLAAAETVHVHLMHRHRSGNYEASSLRLSKGRLIMVFNDRERTA